MGRLIAFCLCICLCHSVVSQPIKVEVVENDGKYQLLRGGQPYVIKGAGMDENLVASLAKKGGNSLRTWSVDTTGDFTQTLLDDAHALGMTVILCLDVKPERKGFDYNDTEAVKKQFDAHKKAILRFKDHPALLAWMIGNELNLFYENPKVWSAVGDIAAFIQKVDPYHPVTTALAGYREDAMRDIQARAPDIDFLSIQLYADLINLPTYVREGNFTEPYMVTEWGAVGHWEIYATPWGAPVENTSTQKAAQYLKSYQQVMAPYGDQIIGNYVFLWGQKQEKTPTWYGVFLPTGEETEAIDVMYKIWNGDWPDNRAPQVSSIKLNGKVGYDNIQLTPGKQYSAIIDASDPNQDTLRYYWELREETQSTATGGDFEEAPPVVTGMIDNVSAASVELTAPSVEGAYRLFVYVYDGKGKAGHANVPFYVGQFEGGQVVQ